MMHECDDNAWMKRRDRRDARGRDFSTMAYAGYAPGHRVIERTPLEEALLEIGDAETLDVGAIGEKRREESARGKVSTREDDEREDSTSAGDDVERGGDASADGDGMEARGGRL